MIFHAFFPPVATSLWPGSGGSIPGGNGSQVLPMPALEAGWAKVACIAAVFRAAALQGDSIIPMAECSEKGRTLPEMAKLRNPCTFRSRKAML